MEQYVAPALNKDAFNCPQCNAYADQYWSEHVSCKYKLKIKVGNNTHGNFYATGFSIAKCNRCEDFSIWKGNILIYPSAANIPFANSDMPENVKHDYNEARLIAGLSPKGAAALLRLAIQKLCIHLGGKGKNINEDIKLLVANGLPEMLQQALDSVRVVGNNAVHPGQIDLNDKPETATALFGFINVIVDLLITQPRKIEEYYSALPEGARKGIEHRDKKKPI